MKKTNEIKNIKMIAIMIIIAGCIIGFITFIMMANSDKDYRTNALCSALGIKYCREYKTMSLWEYINDSSQNSYWIALSGIISGFSVIAITFYKKYEKQEINITNEHVYGKRAFGKTYDLPLKNIVSCEIGSFYGLNINTSSEKIKFKFIKNNDKIQKELSTLLLKKDKNNHLQKDKEDQNIEKLKSYKELLDSGAITEEEYNKKKRDLLNL